MIKEAIGFGATVDEAKEDAILKLGAKIEEDVQIEIISLPKKKVLGIFGGAQAEVRAYVERPDKPAKKNNKPAKKASMAININSRKVSSVVIKTSRFSRTQNRISYRRP